MSGRPLVEGRAADLRLLASGLPQFFRFCGTDALGFIVDAGILLMMTKINHLSPNPITWHILFSTQTVGLGSNFGISFLIIFQLPLV
jgi:hypothetical protein